MPPHVFLSSLHQSRSSASRPYSITTMHERKSGNAVLTPAHVVSAAPPPRRLYKTPSRRRRVQPDDFPAHSLASSSMNSNFSLQFNENTMQDDPSQNPDLIQTSSTPQQYYPTFQQISTSVPMSSHTIPTSQPPGFMLAHPLAHSLQSFTDNRSSFPDPNIRLSPAWPDQGFPNASNLQNLETLPATLPSNSDVNLDVGLLMPPGYSPNQSTMLTLGEPIERPRKQFVCPTCQNIYPKRSLLRTHQRSHTGERPYACYVENCTKTFFTPSNLNRHLRQVHSLDIPRRQRYDLSSSPEITRSSSPASGESFNPGGDFDDEN